MVVHRSVQLASPLVDHRGDLAARLLAGAPDERVSRPGAEALSPPSPHEDERALIDAALDGDRGAFDVLVRRHADRLHAVVRRFSASESDAEEATQEAFVRAWRSLGRFRGDARFFTWLYRIGVNEAKRIGERAPSAGTVASVEERPVDHLGDPRPGPGRSAEAGELRDVLEQAVRALPEKYRAAVILRDVEGLSTTEAAGLLGLREAAFKSRLHRGRMALREDVASYLDEGRAPGDPRAGG